MVTVVSLLLIAHTKEKFYAVIICKRVFNYFLYFNFKCAKILLNNRALGSRFRRQLQVAASLLPKIASVELRVSVRAVRSPGTSVILEQRILAVRQLRCVLVSS